MKESKIPKFRRCVLQNFPFIEEDFDALTDYELLCKVVQYLNLVIDHQNGVDEKIDGLVEGFAELKSYVDNYFANLDVQEEINNKLEDMAEGGELASIIAQFLELAPVFGYDNINAMATATNLSDGCIARVLGNISAAAGDGAYYKVRTKESGESGDGYLKVEIGDSLIADRIKNAQVEDYIGDNYINVKYNGAKGDGETDDYAVLQDLIDNNHNKTLFFPDGEYLISQPLNIETENAKNICFKLSPNAIITTNSSIDYLIEIGLEEGVWSRYEQGNCTIIDGGIFDATNCLKGAIHHVANRKETQIMNAQILNAHKGIVCDLGTNTNSSSDLYISNLNIFGRSSYEDGSVGLEFYSFDNKVYDVRIARFQTGVYDHSGNYYENVHVLMSEGNISYSDEQYNKTKCYVHAGNGGDSKLLDFYNDTCAIGFEQQDNNFTSLIHCFQYWWKSTAGSDLVFYRTSSGSQSEFNITDCNVQCPATTNTVKGLELLDPAGGGSNSGYRQYLGVYDSIKLTNNIEHNVGKIALEDWINCTAIQTGKDTITVSGPWVQQMDANKYYPIAYAKEGSYSVIVRVGNYQIIRVGFKIDSSDTRIVSVENLYNNTQTNNLTIAICNKGTDADGRADGYLCIKPSTGGLGFNVSIGDTKSWNQKLFVKKNYFQALNNPTVNDSESFNPA